MSKKKEAFLDKVRAVLEKPEGDVRKLRSGLRNLEKTQVSIEKTIKVLDEQEAKMANLKDDLKAELKTYKAFLKEKAKSTLSASKKVRN